MKQRRSAIVLCHVDRTTSIQKLLSNVLIPKPCSVVQCGLSIDRSPRHICPFIRKQLYHPRLTAERRHQKRRYSRLKNANVRNNIASQQRASLTKLVASNSAPCRSSRFAMSLLPVRAARNSGALSNLSRMFASAPASSSADTTSACSASAAKCKADAPLLRSSIHLSSDAIVD